MKTIKKNKYPEKTNRKAGRTKRNQTPMGMLGNLNLATENGAENI